MFCYASNTERNDYKLEKELGYTLFDRRHKPIQTTTRGTAFMRIAKDIIEKRNQLKLADQNSLFEGILTIGIIPTVATSILPIIIEHIVKEHPNLSLNIKEMPTKEILKHLAADMIDYGIMATPLNDNQFQCHSIYNEALMSYGIDSDNEFVSIEELKSERIWLLDEGHCFRNQVASLCQIQSKSNQLTKVRFEGNSFETLVRLTDNYGGCTLIPELYVRHLNNEQSKKVRPIIQPPPAREISVVTYRSTGKEHSKSTIS